MESNSTNTTFTFTDVEALQMACATWEAREVVWNRAKTELMEALRIMITETALCVNDADSEEKLKRAMSIYAKYDLLEMP